MACPVWPGVLNVNKCVFQNTKTCSKTKHIVEKQLKHKTDLEMEKGAVLQ